MRSFLIIGATVATFLIWNAVTKDGGNALMKHLDQAQEFQGIG
ncbi:hypothetical protein [Mesorhizobium sp.]|nr:hypothetical protein [Mesorhizobium sp.]